MLQYQLFRKTLLHDVACYNTENRKICTPYVTRASPPFKNLNVCYSVELFVSGKANPLAFVKGSREKWNGYT